MRYKYAIIFLLMVIFYSCTKKAGRETPDLIELQNKANRFYANQEYDSANYFYNQYLEFNSNNADIIKQVALCEMNLKDYNSAINYFERAISHNCDSLEYVYNNIGFCYAQIFDYNKSIKYFNKAILINPNEYYFFSNRGRVLLLKSPPDFDGACEDYYTALKLNPEISNSSTDSLCRKILN